MKGKPSPVPLYQKAVLPPGHLELHPIPAGHLEGRIISRAVADMASTVSRVVVVDAHILMAGDDLRFHRQPGRLVVLVPLRQALCGRDNERDNDDGKNRIGNTDPIKSNPNICSTSL